MVIRARPIIPHLLASGGVATNVSRGGSGWWGCRSLPFGRSRGLPASKPAPGPREPCDASWIDGSREEDARTIVRPRQSFPTCAGEVAPVASIARTAPGCGAGRKSHLPPTTGVDRCPAPPPGLSGLLFRPKVRLATGCAVMSPLDRPIYCATYAAHYSSKADGRLHAKFADLCPDPREDS